MSDATFTTLAVRWKADIKSLDGALAAGNSRIDKYIKETESKYGRMTDAISKAARSMTMNVTLPIAGIGMASIAAAMKMDSLDRGMVAVMKSSGAAKQEMEALVEVSKLPGLGYAEAVQGSIKLQAVGESAKEARTNMIAFGNAIATVGGGKAELDGVLRQITQMESKGKVMAEDIRIIQEYVPQMSQAMKAAFGTADTEALQKMGVDARTFISAISKELDKLPKVTGGIKNEFENLQDDLFRSMASAGKNMLPTVTELIKAADDLLKGFQALSPGEQEFIIKTALVAAAIGPVLMGFNGLVTAGTNLKIAYTAIHDVIIAKQAAMVADTAASKTATVAEEAHTAAMTKAIVAYDAEYAAAQKTTAATAANSAAQSSSLSALKLTTSQWLLLGTAVAGLTINYYQHIAAVKEHVKALQEEALASSQSAINSGTYGKDVTAANNRQENKAGWNQSTVNNLQKLSNNQINSKIEQLRSESNEALKKFEEYDRATGYFQPFPEGDPRRWTNITRSGFAEDAQKYKEEYQRLIAQVEVLKGIKSARGQVDEQRRNIDKDALKKQQETIADNDRLNRTAVQEKYVLSQSTDLAKQQAQAWVDLVNAKADINKRKEEARTLLRIDLDVTAQIATAEYDYKTKLAQITETQRQTHLDEAAAVKSAQLSLAAIRTRNQYERERLQVEAELVTTRRELAKSKASQADIMLAEAQADERVQEIYRRKAEASREAQRDEWFAAQELAALNADNKHQLDRIDAFKQFFSYAETLTKDIDAGLPWEDRFALALAKLRKAKIKIDEDAAKEAEQKRQDQLKKSFDIEKQTADANAKAVEDHYYLRGDEKTGKLKAFRIQSDIQDKDLTLRENLAKTTEEKNAIAAERRAQALARQRGELDIMTGGISNFIEKVKQRKQDDVRAWHEQAEAARRYHDELANNLGIVSLESMRDRSILAGVRMSQPMPWIPPQPSSEITSSDVETTWIAMLDELKQQTQQTQETLQVLQRVLSGRNGS